MPSTRWDRGWPRRLPNRLLWLLLCVPWLTGPTQGAVGACSCDPDPLSGPADVRAYCQEREELICVREFERGRYTELERDDCRRAAIDACALRTFPPGCEPTVRQAQACLNALHSRSTLEQQADNIRACRELCDVNDAVDQADSDAGAAVQDAGQDVGQNADSGENEDGGGT